MVSMVVVVVIQDSFHIAGDKDFRCSAYSAFSRAKSQLGIDQKNTESCEVACFLLRVFLDTSGTLDREGERNTPLASKSPT